MMKNLIFSTVIMLTAVTSLVAQKNDEQDIANTVEKLKKAMVDGDKTVLEALTMDKLSYGHSSGKVENKADFVGNIVSGKSDFVTIDLSDQAITVSGNTAIVRHRLDAKTNDSGKPGEVHLLILLIFQKDHKQWKLLARQAVKTS